MDDDPKVGIGATIVDGKWYLCIDVLANKPTDPIDQDLKRVMMVGL